AAMHVRSETHLRLLGGPGELDELLGEMVRIPEQIGMNINEHGGISSKKDASLPYATAWATSSKHWHFASRRVCWAIMQRITRDHISYAFDRHLEPVLRVADGEVFQVETEDSRTGRTRMPETTRPEFLKAMRSKGYPGNPVTGPI